MALSGSISNEFKTGWRIIVEWSASQSISSNYSNVTAKFYLEALESWGAIYSSASKTCKIIIDGTTYSRSVSVALSGNQKKLLATSSKKIYHNSNGTGDFTLDGYLDIKVTLSGQYIGRVNLTGKTFTLNTIPRASTISSIADFTIGNDIPISIERASTGFTHKIVMYAGTKYIGEWDGIGSSGTLVLNSTHQNRIYSHIPDATSASITVYCYTYSGSTQIGSRTSESIKAIVSSSIKPTISDIDFVANDGILAGHIAGFYQNVTKLNIRVVGASGVKYSTVEKIEIEFNGDTYSGSEANTPVISKYGSMDIVAKVTDSRGRVGTRTESIYVDEYKAPTVDFRVVRANSDGTLNPIGDNAKIILDCTAELLGGTNVIYYRIFKKSRGASVWTEIYNAVEPSNQLNYTDVLSGYPITESFDFKVEITDSAYIIPVEKVLSTGKVVMAYGKDGVGIGKVYENGRGILQVGGDIDVEGFVTNNEQEYNLTLLNGWTGDLKCKRNAMGMVHVYGKIKAGAVGFNVEIANLPAGYNPYYTSFTTTFSDASNGYTHRMGLHVNSDVGQIQLRPPASNELPTGREIYVNMMYQS